MKTEASPGLGFDLGWDQFTLANLAELKEVGQDLGFWE